MNIKALIVRLFKSNNRKSQDIINLSGVIQIPNRKYFKDDIARLALLDKYKEEYLKILKEKRTILSNDLHSNNLEDDISVNIALLLNLCLKEKDNPSTSQINEIDLEIDIIKLRLYLNEINHLEEEVLLKLIALKEISKELKLIVSPNKRNAIGNEINNLTNTLIILMSQKRAIEIETSAYLKDIETHSFLNKTSEDIKQSLFQKKQQSILELALIFIPEQIHNEIYTVIDLANLERKLEIYVYNHKEDVKKMNSEVEAISNSRVQLLKEIEALELKYLLFDKYGRNLVTEDDLCKLYRIKFDLLTGDISNFNRTVVTNKTNERELEFYKKIVMEKIERIVIGKNEAFNDLFGANTIDINDPFGINVTLAIRNVIALLKNGDKQFNPEKILEDKFLFNILLCLDKPISLGTFFQKYMIYKSELNFMQLWNYQITWDNQIPLSTVFTIDYFNSKMSFRTEEYKLIDESPRHIRLKYLKKIYELMYSQSHMQKPYDLTYGAGNNKTYRLPEGIKELTLKSMFGDRQEFIDRLTGDSIGTTVYLPSSLIKFTSSEIFRRDTIKKIVLNEGLEIFEDYSQSFENITIPSTLKELKCSYQHLKVIRFTNYKESIILNNRMLLERLLKNLVEVKVGNTFKNQKSDIIIPIEATLKIDKIILSDDFNEPIEIYGQCIKYRKEAIYRDTMYTSLKDYIQSQMIISFLKEMELKKELRKKLEYTK